MARRCTVSLPLSEARHIAEVLRAEMLPHSERVEIAGSIRRQKNEFKDVEMVVLPRWTRDTDLFGSPTSAGVNHLYEWGIAQPAHLLRWIKPATSAIIPWTIKPDARYWRGFIAEIGVKVD